MVLWLYHKLKHNPQLFSGLLEQFKTLLERELRANRRISYINKEMQHLVLVRLTSREFVDFALYLSQQDEIGQKLKSLRKLLRRIMETAAEDSQIQATEGMLDYMEDSPEWMEEVSGDLFEYLVERLTLVSAEELKIKLRNGVELTEHMERTVW